MELSVARSLAWAAEHGGQALPAEIAKRVGHVLAVGAAVEVAPHSGHFISVDEQQEK